MPAAEPKHFYEFGPYRLDSAERLLWREGHRVALTPRAADILLVLVKTKGRLLTKEELMQSVWPDIHVEEGNLTQNIFMLRKVLGNDAAHGPYIETLTRRGYRFLAQVEERWEDAAPCTNEDPPSAAGPPQSLDTLPAAPRRSNLRMAILPAAFCAVCLAAAMAFYPFASHPAAQSLGKSPPDVKAYLSYLKGRQQLSQRTLPGVMAAIDSFADAIHQDPRLAVAQSGFADALALLGSYGVYPPKDVFPRATAAAMQALQLNPDLAEAHASLAAIQGGYEWNWPAAEAEFRKAIALKPTYAAAHQWYAEHLTALGRHPEAIHEAEIAQSLEPHSPTVISVLGLVLYFARQNDRAIAQYRKALEFNPNHILSYFFLGYAEEQKGLMPEAISDFRKGIALANGAGTAHLGHALAMAGRQKEAQSIIDNLKAHPADHYVCPLDIAIVYLGLGDRESAFAWLDRACEDHSQWLQHLKVDPRYDPIRGDPRFSVLLRKLNVE